MTGAGLAGATAPIMAMPWWGWILLIYVVAVGFAVYMGNKWSDLERDLDRSFSEDWEVDHYVDGFFGHNAVYRRRK